MAGVLLLVTGIRRHQFVAELVAEDHCGVSVSDCLGDLEDVHPGKKPRAFARFAGSDLTARR